MASGQKIHLDKLLYTHYQHTNLEAVKKFYADFGLIIAEERDDLIYYRGFGNDPYVLVIEKSPDDKKHFLGAGWVAVSYQDLENAARQPGASPIQTLNAPGGGQYVDVPDPNGLNVRCIYGLQFRDSAGEAKPQELITNSWSNKPRKGQFQRFEQGPSKVHKLGHYGILTDKVNFDATVDWYQNTFNLATSDVVYSPESNKDIMNFMHIDKGEEYTDHHSFFILASMTDMTGSHAHHSSFEVDDMETQQIGRNWLFKQGWTNCWGIGRHVLGSQIFDYWFDCAGNVVEHYTDGDLVNCKSEKSREKAAPDTMASWGPNVSLAFLSGREEDMDMNKLSPVAAAH